jgi:uncharacterized Zn-binding protein involved in type VI secretion
MPQSLKEARAFVQRREVAGAGNRAGAAITSDNVASTGGTNPGGAANFPMGEIINSLSGGGISSILGGASGIAAKFLPPQFASLLPAGQMLMTGGLSKLISGGAGGLLSLGGLAGIAGQFLPPWAGDAMAAGQALMSGDPMAMLDGLVSKFMPPELKAAYDALKKSGALEDLKSAIFAPPADKPSETPESGTAPWAARLSDTVVCKGGAGVIIKPCLPTVLIGGLPAARVTDIALCNGFPVDAIRQGEDTVLMGNLPAARMGDPTIHDGQVTLGFQTVHIGKSLAQCQKCLEDAAMNGHAMISGAGITTPMVGKS